VVFELRWWAEHREKLPSSRDLATAFGCSHQTVINIAKKAGVQIGHLPTQGKDGKTYHEARAHADPGKSDEGQAALAEPSEGPAGGGHCAVDWPVGPAEDFGAPIAGPLPGRQTGPEAQGADEVGLQAVELDQDLPGEEVGALLPPAVGQPRVDFPGLHQPHAGGEELRLRLAVGAWVLGDDDRVPRTPHHVAGPDAKDLACVH
jgi:hypothetical protein